MGFRTKLDFSDNRQAKQDVRTVQVLSGNTSFGVPFSALTTGPDPSFSGVSTFITSILSTYSGNSGTTIYTWYDNAMIIGEGNLSALTPSNSAITQNTGNVFAANTTTIIDNNTIVLTYTGVSFDIDVLTMDDDGFGNFSGSVTTTLLNFLSAGTLDFTGRTIWVDVSGITRTNELIITKNPQIGYVWTCSDSEGKGEWNISTSGGTFTGNTSGSCISNLWVTNIHGCSPISIQPTLSDDVNIVKGGGNLGIGVDPIYKIHASGQTSNTQLAYVDITSTPYFALIANPAYWNGIQVYDPINSISIVMGYRGVNEPSLTPYGQQGDVFIYGSVNANGINIINNNGTSKEDYIRLYAGTDATASNADIHIQGTGVTRGYVGIGINTPTVMLDVNGNGRFRTVGSTASAGALHYTSDGTLTTNTSDIRLKTNIVTITSALDKVKALRGVTYNWVESPTGDTRIGFIAQEVNSVVPELAFMNPNSVEKYMGVHYDNVTALLVEAVKELSSGVTTSHNTHLETQTILAEDNNIELNYAGNTESAIGGGITILHAKGENISAELLTNINGDWVTNNDFKPKALTIPNYTPTSSNDNFGVEGNITRDDNYLYVKTISGWRRTNLENF